VIAMTNLPEAELTREAEVAFATMAVITDVSPLQRFAQRPDLIFLVRRRRFHLGECEP